MSFEILTALRVFYEFKSAVQSKIIEKKSRNENTFK